MAELAFNRFVFDTRRRVLLHDGAPVPATPKTLDLLELLANRSGCVVTKDEIIREVWHSEAVSDATLAQHIMMLRKILGGEHRANDYVITVPRRGYRFVATAQGSSAGTTTENDEAFRAYCHGQYQLQQRTSEGLRDAMRWFERATLLDAEFGAGYAGLAAASAMLGIYMHEAPDRAFPRALGRNPRARTCTRPELLHDSR